MKPSRDTDIIKMIFLIPVSSEVVKRHPSATSSGVAVADSRGDLSRGRRGLAGRVVHQQEVVDVQHAKDAPDGER
jgi:hypothetical protein